MRDELLEERRSKYAIGISLTLVLLRGQRPNQSSKKEEKKKKTEEKERKNTERKNEEIKEEAG